MLVKKFSFSKVSDPCGKVVKIRCVWKLVFWKNQCFGSCDLKLVFWKLHKNEMCNIYINKIYKNEICCPGAAAKQQKKKVIKDALEEKLCDYNLV